MDAIADQKLTLSSARLTLCSAPIPPLRDLGRGFCLRAFSPPHKSAEQRVRLIRTRIRLLYAASLWRRPIDGRDQLRKPSPGTTAAKERERLRKPLLIPTCEKRSVV